MGVISTLLSILLGLFILYDKTIGAKLRKQKKADADKSAMELVNHLQTNDLKHIGERLDKIEDAVKQNGHEISKLWTEITSQQRVCADRHK